MIPGIHNYSEIGKLNKVLLHRPGLELEALTPSTMERLLFDDIPFLKVAQQEHDRFAEVLRENGVEVVAGCPELPIREVLEKYMANSLDTGENACGGEGHDHAHCHHHGEGHHCNH